MIDLISRQAAINELVRWGKLPEYTKSERLILGSVIGMLSSLPSAEPVKNELVADFVDTAEKAAKVEIMSEKDAQATLDAWKMCNLISEDDHE